MSSIYNRWNIGRPSSARPDNKAAGEELPTASLRSATNVDRHCPVGDKTDSGKQPAIGVNSVLRRTDCFGHKLGR